MQMLQTEIAETDNSDLVADFTRICAVQAYCNSRDRINDFTTWYLMVSSKWSTQGPTATLTVH